MGSVWIAVRQKLEFGLETVIRVFVSLQIGFNKVSLVKGGHVDRFLVAAARVAVGAGLGHVDGFSISRRDQVLRVISSSPQCGAQVTKRTSQIHLHSTLRCRNLESNFNLLFKKSSSKFKGKVQYQDHLM